MKTLVETIVDAATDLLFDHAAKSSDAFRQWFYPNSPRSYNVNPAVSDEIYNLVIVGKSAQQIADEIHAKYR